MELRGREHYDAAGPRTLIIYNPGSILDPLILAAVLPHRVTLLADRALEHKWWMRPVCALADTQFFDFSSPAATVSLVHALARNGRCMVFHSGSLGNDPRYIRILEAAGVIAEKADATLLPVRIDGASSTVFSYLRHKGRRRWFPRVTVSVLEVQKFRSAEGVTPRERRRRMGERLYDIMTELEYRSSMEHCNLMQGLVEAVRLSGRRFPIAEDQDRHVLTYGSLLLKLSVLGRAFRRLFRGESTVGFLLPTSLPGLVAFFGLHSAGLVPAMLNFTSGISSVVSCCRTVRLSSVLTSRRFLALADLTAMEQALKDAGCASCTLRTWPKGSPSATRRSARFLRGCAWRRPPRPTIRPRSCSPRAPKACQGRAAQSREHHRQPLSGAQHAHHRLRRQAVQLPAHVPRLRARHLHAAARARRRAGVPLSFTASLPHRAPALLREPVHHHLRHGHLLRGLRALRPPLRLLSRAACHHRRGKNAREHAPRVA